MNRIAVFTLLVLASIATVAATPSFSIEPASGTVPLDVSYACSAPAQAFPPVTHVISFGDGHQTTQASGSYRYTDVGTFTAKCVVYDLLGDRYESSKTVRVEPRSGPKPTLSVSPTSGRVPLDVSYSCTSEGGVAPVTYVVSFGDGHQTTKASGTHRYTDDGTFEVTCTAYDLLGDTGTARKTVVVEAPHTFDSISFSVSPTSGRVPLDVSYSCSAVGGTAPVSYVISFGDGHQTTQASGSYRYTDVGTFTATCTAYDLLGDKISATRTIRVDPPIQPLQVSYSVSPSSGDAPLSTQHSCSVSGGVAPYSYTITTGDGRTISASSASHVYHDAGSYVARCSVTDSRGVSASRSRTVTVSEPVVPKDPLGVSLSVSPVSGYAPLTVSYSCSVSGGRDPIDARVRVGSSTSSALSGDITFESSGVYTIVCEATDADGDSASDSKTVSVSAAPKLSASLSADPSEGFAPLTTNYACSASGGIAPYSYSVSFGDGSSSTDRQGSYTYHDSGSYTMTCTVRDAIGQKATRSRTITVDEQPAPLKVSYSVSPSSGDAPLSTQHSCSVSGGVAPYSYTITTGDGRTIGASSASHVYYDAGSYVARCSVTDSRGVSASRSRTVTVFEPEPPVDPLGVSLSVSPVSGYAPLTVSYSCSVSGGRDPVDARVRVGSSATSALSGDITFESPGVYTVVCDATDAENNHASDSVTITVEKPAPEPFSLSLSATPQRGVEPFTTRIACEAHGGYGTVSYMLDPAVGDVIEANAPIDEQVHYSSYGVYDVTCTATDSLDRSVSDTVPVIVIPDSAVSITPQGPTSDDDLSCQVDAYPHGSFDFNWYRNGELVRSDSGVSSSVVKSDETAPGDVYTCVAKMPIVGDEIGRDSVSIDDPAPEPLSMSFSVHPASGEAPLDVLYVCEAFGGKAPFEYVVDIEHTWFSTSIHESEASIRLHQPGTYVFTCTATDDAGSSISEERTVVVTPRDYEGDWSISADPLSGPAPLPVSFTSDTSQIPIVGGVEWDFGDGHRFSGSSRVHTFARKGTYEVTATVRLEDGQVLTRSVTIHVAAREDPIIEVDASRVRITRAFAEVVGDRVYATLTVRNDAGFTVRGMTATMQVPEHGVWRSQPMPEIPHGSSRTISFFVPIDDVSFETFAVFKAENRDVDLARTVIVLR